MASIIFGRDLIKSLEQNNTKCVCECDECVRVCVCVCV